MSLPITLMVIGIAALLLSAFYGARQTGHDDVEQLSISLHQETSQLKKRIKALEEELMISTSSSTGLTQPRQEKQVHSIIVNQIIALHNQHFSLEEIAKRSSLPISQVLAVLRSRGVQL